MATKKADDKKVKATDDRFAAVRAESTKNAEADLKARSVGKTDGKPNKA